MPKRCQAASARFWIAIVLGIYESSLVDETVFVAIAPDGGAQYLTDERRLLGEP